MCKGASGSKICLMCQNLVKSQYILPPGPRLVEFTCCDWARIAPHTSTSILRLWNYLRGRWNGVGIGSGRFHESLWTRLSSAHEHNQTGVGPANNQ